MSKQSNDIEALCTHTALDRTRYQTFEETSAESAADLDAIFNQILELEAPGAALPESPEREPEPAASRPDSRAKAPLELVPPNAPHAGQAANPPHLCILPMSGGAGATTLLATLAQLWSAEGHPVDLADRAAPSLMPLYFGGNGVIEGIWSQLSEAASSHPGIGPIRIMAPYPAVMAMARESGSGRDPICLLDGGRASVAECVRAGGPETTYLLAATPDLASRVRMPAIVAELRSLGVRVKVLLSRVSEGFAAVELERLKQQLGDALLPVTIRNSELVSQAFDAGKTVISYAPDSQVAGDYRAVARYLYRSLLSAAPAAASPGASNSGRAAEKVNLHA